MSNNEMIIGANRIMQLLPHRYPFLLIDKIIACTPGESITAVKNVTINEPFFQGHFPGNPVMPGVLIIEAMAQAGGVLSHVTVGDIEPKPLYYLVAVDETRFRKPVTAGDQLLLTVSVDRVIRGMWRYVCSASVDGSAAVSARIMCAPGASQ
ncbi:MAG: 3-hydroxyacyl-ACP dehydratase FabZ [Gammaproteobacteria bacterium]|nr:3-hydroxyacyl-ACP dehydratase FabZ [Gammaproteobacteria bacterium]MDH4252936.1 3-hydroxyacyl-ACP dehydratase FabZ [Gammaproteobacteria bacterium]MDH5308378.1 3-hydroxyacyl-ACP dehydratase FabZ [Gammaproteobacteria bacterium]